VLQLAALNVHILGLCDSSLGCMPAADFGMSGLCRQCEPRHSSFSHTVLACTLQLGKEGKLKLGSVRHFVLDECDKMLDKLGAHMFDGPRV
jgi:hypothetical protein